MTQPRPRPTGPVDTEDSAKRRQIVEGARSVFLAHGFDAASMGEIAKVAGVSKGTLYVYFKDKDELFKAIVEKECVFQAEGIFAFDVADPGCRRARSTRVGVAFVQTLCAPSRQAPLRAVIAIADRMPNIGRTFYETGPAVGIAKMRAYLEAQVTAGRLMIPDCEVAAAQFIESCHATLFKPLLFNSAPPPPLERIEYVVGIAVKTFMAAYAKRTDRDTAAAARLRRFPQAGGFERLGDDRLDIDRAGVKGGGRLVRVARRLGRSGRHGFPALGARQRDRFPRRARSGGNAARMPGQAPEFGDVIG